MDIDAVNQAYVSISQTIQDELEDLDDEEMAAVMRKVRADLDGNLEDIEGDLDDGDETYHEG